MKVGLLTGGGDCPGLNAVIRAVVQRVANGGGTCIGIMEGWRGARQRDSIRELHVSETDGIIARGGTILGSSRTNPFKNAARRIFPSPQREFQGAQGLDALVAIGGDDTLGRRLPALHRTRHADRRRPQDDRQRPDGDRLHLRLRHRHQHRDRGRRPPPHDHREPPAHHGRRDDGPPRRLDRLLLRHLRRPPTTSSCPKSPINLRPLSSRCSSVDRSEGKNPTGS